MQSIKGHFHIVDNTQDIETLLADKNIDEPLKNKLALILKARQFAVDELYLSVNDSFFRYADLKRDYALKNLFAAEEFSTELYQWCYPVIGCAGYRGYFDEPMLAEYRNALDNKGYDTYVADVTAYSTLGWFDDPALNTYIDWPEYKLVGLMFHELAHQHLYIDDDTFFNESFAMAVEQAGLTVWFSDNQNQEQLLKYQQNKLRNKKVMALVEHARDDLKEIYRQELSDSEKRHHKESVMNTLREQYVSTVVVGTQPMKPGLSGTTINNARLGMMVAYNKYVPAFLAMLRDHHNNFQTFYAHVADVAQLSSERREQCLLLWSAYAEKKKEGGMLLNTKEIPFFCQLKTG